MHSESLVVVLQGEDGTSIICIVASRRRKTTPSLIPSSLPDEVPSLQSLPLRPFQPYTSNPIPPRYRTLSSRTVIISRIITFQDCALLEVIRLGLDVASNRHTKRRSLIHRAAHQRPFLISYQSRLDLAKESLTIYSSS